MKPIASLDGAHTITFLDQGYGEDYKNLSSVYLYSKVKMIRPTTTSGGSGGGGSGELTENGRRRRRRQIPDTFNFEQFTYDNPYRYERGTDDVPPSAPPPPTPKTAEQLAAEVKAKPVSEKPVLNEGEVVDENNNDDDALGSAAAIKPEEVKSSVVNNLMHSLFRRINLTLNGKQISQNSFNYSYRAYIENLINYDKTTSEQQLNGAIWTLDDAGKFDVMNGKANSAFGKRGVIFGSDETVELIGKLHLDMLNTPNFLMNNVDFRLTFELSEHSFYMLGITFKIFGCIIVY